MDKAYIAEKQSAMVRHVVAAADERQALAAADSEFNVDWKSISAISTVDHCAYWFRLWPKNRLTFAPGRRTLHVYKVYGWGDWTGRVFCGKSFLDEAPRLLPLCKQCLRFFRIAVCDELSARRFRSADIQLACEARRVASYA
jgi:hypothetical protein